MNIVYMPRWGITMEEGTVVEWLVAPGDRISAGQPVCVVETEKLTQEVESPLSGVVAKLLVATGSTAAVGEPILLLD